jgi:hypothetical protein
MARQGSGIPLRDRVRVGGSLAARPGGHAGVRPGALPGPVCPARHCWVADAVDGDGEKRPGLLLEWRQRDRRWEGLVVYAARVRTGSWGLVQEWLPAELLAPA